MVVDKYIYILVEEVKSTGDVQGTPVQIKSRAAQASLVDLKRNTGSERQGTDFNQQTAGGTLWFSSWIINGSVYIL